MAMKIPRPSLPNAPGGTVRTFTVGVVVLVLVTMAGACMTGSVGSGERGVKYSSVSGTNTETVYGEGMHVFWPWENLIVYDVRYRSNDERLEALSSNGLTITMDVSVRYRPDPRALPLLHTTLGPEYYERLIAPELRSAAREIVGHYTPEDLYSTRRTELQTRIAERVARVAQTQHISVDAVLIRDVALPPQIRAAIETKLQEEQRVQQLTFGIERARREAEQRRIEAEGQAAAQRSLNASLTPALLQYEGIQATRALAESDNAKVVVIGGDGSGLPLILGQ